MSDSELIAKWAKIDDPVEALGQLLEHQMFLGSDPYYRDLDNALMEMAERAYNTAQRGEGNVQDR